MKRKSYDFSLILACYNEAGLFAESMARIREALATSKFAYEIILVDDASRDETPKLIRKLEQKNRHIRAIYHQINQGRGQTVADGMRAAYGKVVGYIDIDCEVSPVYVPHMISLILDGKADVAIGKRYYRTSVSSALREILSRGYMWLSNMMVGTGGLDTETGYKFFNRRKILPILGKTEHPGWFWDTEIMVYARRAGLRIVEMPVLFLRRFDKKSSVNILKDTVDYLVNLWKFRRRLDHA